MDQTHKHSSALIDLIRLRRASAYGAGRGMDTAIATSRRLSTYGIPSILGYTSFASDSPREVADLHLAAFEQIAAEDLDCHVSVKLNGLDYQQALVDELVVAAARTGRRLHIDALHADSAERVFELLEAAPHPAALGVTLPGRWQRSVADVERAIRGGMAVRVVKGHWDDAGGANLDPVAGFSTVVDGLAGRAVAVGVATHNSRLLRSSLKHLLDSGTPCETELYLGMPFPGPSAVATEFGVPIRVYVPFGDAWPGYGIPDLLTHPATITWLIQDLVWGREKTWRAIQRTRRKA
jgi:proline dehydrogenase